MDELGVALIGAGFMGRAHSQAYEIAQTGAGADGRFRFRREIVVEADESRAAAAAADLGWGRGATSWPEAVEDPSIDIVDICVPPELHAEIAMVALEHGKHVFCEKPLANDLATAERMSRAAADADVVTQVGFNYRNAPAVSFARQLLDGGRLGRPLMFRGQYLQDAAFGADPNRWRATRATGGSGMVSDIGSHVIDVGELLFGDIVRVSGLVRAIADDTSNGWLAEADRRSERRLDDAGAWIAEFDNGAIGAFSVNAYSSGRKNELSFAFDGSLGAVEFNWNRREEFRVSYVDEPADHQGFRAIHTNDQHPGGWWRLAGLGTGYVDVMAIQFQDFATAILDGRPSAPDFATAARVQRIVAAVRHSAETGEWVDVADPDLADAEAALDAP